MTRYLFKALMVLAILCSSLFAGAQGMAINTSGSTADQSAMLDVTSTSQGILVPRMLSNQRTSISQPATGLLVYQTDAPAGFYFNSGTPGTPNWISLNAAAAAGSLTGNTLASNVVNANISTLSSLTSNGIVTTSSATGALSVTATTGGGSVVLATSPTLVTPNLGTINSGDGAALTSLNASQLTSGTVAASRGGAGTINGILKADGSGSVLKAVAGTDYQVPIAFTTTGTGAATFNSATGALNIPTPSGGGSSGTLSINTTVLSGSSGTPPNPISGSKVIYLAQDNTTITLPAISATTVGQIIIITTVTGYANGIYVNTGAVGDKIVDVIYSNVNNPITAPTTSLFAGGSVARLVSDGANTWYTW